MPQHLVQLSVTFKVSNCVDLMQLDGVLENMDYTFTPNQDDVKAGIAIVDTEITSWDVLSID